jgi:pyroglutamyl-peptidase
MRILVYGFGPYREFTDNITEKIIRALPREPGVKKLIFPVRFDKAQFVSAVRQYTPDKVLGLGQCTRRRIVLETTARNCKRARKSSKAALIRHNGPSSLSTTLAIKLGRQVCRSRDAGDYVCNFSMYVILDYLSRNWPDVQFGFLHIPRHSDLVSSTELVSRAIKKLGASTIQKSSFR